MSNTPDASASQNPYASPISDEARPLHPSQLNLASNGQRFATLLIDYVGMTVCAVIASVFMHGADDSWLLDRLVGFLVMIVYYVAFEAALGQTPGKMAVGTRVVTLTGAPPSFGQCLGRTFARCVPFEPFSFLGAKSVGWHDDWSRTRVIRTR